MSEEMDLSEAGVEIALSLMLQQLYVLASKQAGLGETGIAAWRDDLEAQIRRIMADGGSRKYEEVAAMEKAALHTVKQVFGPITGHLPASGEGSAS